MQRQSARAERRSGVAHIPEDRLTNGVALDASIADNLAEIATTGRPSPTASSPARIYQQAQDSMQQFDIRGEGADAPMRSLSAT